MAISEKYCLWCGVELEYGVRRDRKRILNHNSASLDVIDRTKPAEEKNVRILCRQCNSAKSTMTDREFMDWLKRIYNKLW